MGRRLTKMVQRDSDPDNRCQQLGERQYIHSTPVAEEFNYGPFMCYVTQMGVGGGGVWFSGKKSYEGVMFNVISVTTGLVGV